MFKVEKQFFTTLQNAEISSISNFQKKVFISLLIGFHFIIKNGLRTIENFRNETTLVFTFQRNMK